MIIRVKIKLINFCVTQAEQTIQGCLGTLKLIQWPLILFFRVTVFFRFGISLCASAAALK
jgi:hypothetical protein